jgi:hypothetical protein
MAATAGPGDLTPLLGSDPRIALWEVGYLPAGGTVYMARGRMRMLVCIPLGGKGHLFCFGAYPLRVWLTSRRRRDPQGLDLAEAVDGET